MLLCYMNDYICFIFQMIGIPVNEDFVLFLRHAYKAYV